MLLMYGLSPIMTAYAIDDEFDHWVYSYYQHSQFCATASVSSVEPYKQSYIVHLDIDPRWSKSMSLAEKDIQQRWFALDCPHQLIEQWRQHTESDLIIAADIEGTVARLSCRDWQKHLY